MKKKILLIPLVLLLAMSLVAMGCPAPAPVEPEPYPAKMITVIAPHGAGGGGDRWARSMSTVAVDHFGQPWHVVNMTGASGVVGWKWVLEQPADGYTILATGSSALQTLALEEKPPISPYDIKVVCFVSLIRAIVISKPGTPWATWEGLQTYVKEHPGELSMEGGTGFMLGTRFLFEQAGIWDKIKFVRATSTGGAVTDFLGGHVELLTASTSTVRPLLPEDGVIIVNCSEIPLPKAKEFEGVRNATDLGYEGVQFPRWLGVHPDTPDEIADFISEKMGSLLKEEAFVKLMGKLGEEIMYVPRDEAVPAFKKVVEAINELL